MVALDVFAPSPPPSPSRTLSLMSWFQALLSRWRGYRQLYNTPPTPLAPPFFFFISAAPLTHPQPPFPLGMCTSASLPSIYSQKSIEPSWKVAEYGGDSFWKAASSLGRQVVNPPLLGLFFFNFSPLGRRFQSSAPLMHASHACVRVLNTASRERAVYTGPRVEPTSLGGKFIGSRS